MSIASEHPADLTFPDKITSDADRYKYLYAATEQLRRKHNTRSGDTSPEANRFRAEWKKPHRKIIAEILRLRKLVKTPDFEPKDEFEQDPALVRLKGDGRADYRNADYKTLTGDDLDAVTGTLEIPDPLENYTTYTKSDPGSDMTVNANDVTVDAFLGTLDQWLYRDMGAAHFGATFEHLFKATATFTASVSGYCCLWAVTNNAGTDDSRDWLTGNAEACFLWWAGYSPQIRLYNSEEGAYDSWASPVSDTPYWFAVERTEWEVIECRIYSDAYTTLLDTLAEDPPDARSYRYVFGACGYNNGVARSMYAVIENLDLQEGGAPSGVVPYSYLLHGANR